jgi:putative lipoic acid-binding regulatory protein
MDEKNPEEFYKKLREQLTETSKWPSNYLYKFIVESETDKIDQINAIFDNMGAVINLKKSKKGKYTSVSVTVNLKSPDEVIAKYKEVGEIEGVISL